ncbi:2-oxo acid dehydrogenase subunit E2 [Candidatus Woesearchaeota archaeon]|nr:MAG: 2-oxo acid dehydrogenase subunit E2 [Candidatus Woesearchaeota archaeon]
MIEIKFPDVGEGISEGVLVKWNVKVGDKVNVDDILAEVETDKAIVEWPSPEAGVVTQLRAKEGDTIKVGDVIVVLDDENKVNQANQESTEKKDVAAQDEDKQFQEKTSTSAPLTSNKRDGEKNTTSSSSPSENKSSHAERVSKDTSEQEATEQKETKQKETKDQFTSTGVVGSLEEAAEEEHYKLKQSKERSTRVKALPATRAVAKSMGVDIESIKGTGKDGLVTLEDVLAAANKESTREAKREAKQENTEQESAIKKDEDHAGKEAVKDLQKKHHPQPLKKLKYNFFGHLDYVPYKGIRKTIGERMVRSHMNTAPVTHHDEADITDLMDIRNKEKKNYEKFDVKLTPLAFITKALCLALEKHPLFNAELRGEDIIIYKYYNVGIAVDTPDGLLVPTIVKAQDKSIQEIAKEIQELAEQARERKLDPAQMKNGTITITNYGSIGGRFATPVINYPQSAILGLGRATEQPVVKEGKIYARLILPFSITFDHRIVDGAEAARFANTLKEYLEDPHKILVEEK